MTTDYRRDFDRYDDRLPTPHDLARIWRAMPEGQRHVFMNLVYLADEPLHNQVVVLTAKYADAGARSTPGQPADGQRRPKVAVGDAPTHAPAATAALSRDTL